MIWFFNWFARVAESPQDNDTPVLEEPTMNEINDDEDGSIRMSHIGAAIIAANNKFPSSNAASSSTCIPSGLAGANPSELLKKIKDILKYHRNGGQDERRDRFRLYVENTKNLMR